jgi:hypothetical protein
MNFQKIKYFMRASLPFMLTFGSLNMILIVGINGVPGNFMGPILEVDTKNFQIPPSSFTSLTGLEVSGGENITAASIGLGDKYTFYLWDYATTTGENKTYHDRNFDYVHKIDLSEITINGNTSSLPHRFSNLKSRFRNKIRFAQQVFLATLFNAFFVIAIGIAALFNVKFRLVIVAFFTGVTFITILIFAALITSAEFGTKDDLKPFQDFGVKSKLGTSDLGIVWFAAVHMLAVCIVWTLMAFGVISMNPAVKTVSKGQDDELLQSSSAGDITVVSAKAAK